jgi:uncharacterized phage protein (TIGR02216 family)
MNGARFSDAARTLAGIAAIALGWRPDEFWRATPEELVIALGGHAAPVCAPPDGDAIAALRAQFPDITEQQDG